MSGSMKTEFECSYKPSKEVLNALGIIDAEYRGYPENLIDLNKLINQQIKSLKNKKKETKKKKDNYAFF